ncbi:MAG: hypothetical protein ACP5FT_01435 [Acidilobus sp.]
MAMMTIVDLLDSEDDGLASRAWYEAVVKRLVPFEQLASRARRLMELLQSPSREARSLAWAAAAELLRASALPKEELAKRKGSLIELLRSRGPSLTSFISAWETAETLAAEGVLTADDLRPLGNLLWDMVDRASGSDKDRLRSIAERLRSAGFIKGPGIRARVLGEDSYIL